MLDENLKNRILRLIRAEVVPAVGCTEPVAVALAVARATELAEADRHCLDKIECRLSGNIIKNAMGVGIPGTGMTGLPIAVALGALQGRSERGLEVLADVSDDDVRRGRETIDRGIISIALADDADDVLYIDVTVTAAGRSGRAIISGGHTRFVYEAGNGKTVLDIRGKRGDGANDSITVPELDMATVWNFAMTVPPDELDFILETRRLNKLAAERALMAEYGHRVGRTLHSERQRSIMGDSIFSRILSYTAAACDARMGGAPVAVMSNSGSGNQGIAATMPVVIYAEEVYADHEKTVRALILSHLTSIYIKQSLGRLSALCGCVVATTGSAAGICYLMGGGYEQVAATVKNMAANLTGMICDGAKPSCAFKLTSGVSTAVISAMVAMEGDVCTSLEGIVDESVDTTISNLTAIGRDGMTQTDAMILGIMTDKSK
ncbi:MAG: serine dehydratase subunit alpha family protein [Muribaculaceae bacterium]